MFVREDKWIICIPLYFLNKTYENSKEYDRIYNIVIMSDVHCEGM